MDHTSRSQADYSARLAVARRMATLLLAGGLATPEAMYYIFRREAAGPGGSPRKTIEISKVRRPILLEG